MAEFTTNMQQLNTFKKQIRKGIACKHEEKWFESSLIKNAYKHPNLQTLIRISNGKLINFIEFRAPASA